MSGNNELTTEEERDLDAFTEDYGAMKTEVVQTGAQLVGSALEVEMMVGSWYVPDEVDVATAGLTLAGKPLKKLYKVGKTLKATQQVAARINRVREKLAGAVSAVRRKLGHSNFAIVMKRKKYRVSREGHLGPGGMREPAKMGEVKEEEEILCNIPGGSCFVKGTLVSTQNGLRAIETLNAKDLVWSRDATSGKTELKPIAKTFEKYATTLALNFSNGETVETTREHPFYVADRGFVKAGELGIGTSIVTRAGPSVQLVSVKAGDAQTVYNFEVADYHTYFVGSGEVWVHNATYSVAASIGNGHAFEKHILNEGQEELPYSVLKDDVLQPWVSQQPRRMARAVLTELGKKTISHRGEYVAMETLKLALQIEPMGVWEQVAERLSAPHKESLQLMWNLRGHLGSWIDTEILLSWAREHRDDERAPLLVADMAPVNGDPLHPLARGLLIEFGSDSKVASSLYSTFSSGSWIGPMSNYLEENARAARAWLSDEHQTVRDWAQKIVRGLEVQIQDAKLREEEEQFLMGNR